MAAYARPNKTESYKTFYNGREYVYQYRYQARRFVTKPVASQPTAYTGRGVHVVKVSGGVSRYALPANNGRCWGYATGNATDFEYATAAAEALNRCYLRFKDSVTEMAQLGNALAERKQAAQMISDRALQLRRSFLALRRGRFDLFASELGLRGKKRKSRSRWSRPRDAAGLWLEYHFGWSPLLKDIYDGCRILESPYRSTGYPVSGSGRGQFMRSEYAWYGNSPSTHRITADAGRISYKQRATVKVTNPDLHRATQLGLTNPVSIAWELIPFSFLVDWFLPVGNFLNSYSDFLGLSFSEASYTRFYSGTSQVTNNSLGVETNRRFPDYTMTQMWSAYSCQRELGLVRPVVYPKQLKGISVVRAATSISLLLQVLKPGS